MSSPVQPGLPVLDALIFDVSRKVSKHAAKWLIVDT